MKKPVLWILGVLAAFVAWAIAWDSVRVFDRCGEEIIREARSPDGVWTAAVIVRNCGATTGYAVAVQIVRTGQPFESGSQGDAFAADSNNEAAPRTAAGGPRVEVQWLAGDHLLVEFDPRARVFRRDSVLNGVRISYAGVDGAR